jgi:hypothetical protein
LSFSNLLLTYDLCEIVILGNCSLLNQPSLPWRVAKPGN